MAGPTFLEAVPASRRPVCPALVTALLLSPMACLAQVSPSVHVADANNQADLAVLRASGDKVSGRTIRNICDTVVRPTISYPASNVAVKVEEDTSGTCSGSNPPSTLTVLVRTGAAWRLSMATTGSGYRLGPVQAGFPGIVVQYPPSQRDCPTLAWDGQNYRFVRPCPGSRGQ